MGFLKVVFFFLLFYWIFKAVARLAMPFLLQMLGRKVKRNFEQQYQNTNRDSNQQQTSKGDVTITYNKKNPKTEPKGNSGGEYVDFEEV